MNKLLHLEMRSIRKEINYYKQRLKHSCTYKAPLSKLRVKARRGSASCRENLGAIRLRMVRCGTIGNFLALGSPCF